MPAQHVHACNINNTCLTCTCVHIYTCTCMGIQEVLYVYPCTRVYMYMYMSGVCCFFVVACIIPLCVCHDYHLRVKLIYEVANLYMHMDNMCVRSHYIDLHAAKLVR